MLKKGLVILLSLGVAFAADSGYVSQTTSSVSIAPQGNLIVATTVTNWDTRASDVLAVKWIAPKGSYCQSSEFVLSRGNATTGDVSWAYRTVVHTASNGAPVVCSGYWVADVINVNTKAILATSGYTVPVPQATTTTTATSVVSTTTVTANS